MDSTLDYYIHVNSSDRMAGGSPAHYTVPLPFQIEKVTKIEFVSAEIPNTLFSASRIRNIYFTLNKSTFTNLTNEDIHCLIPVTPGLWEVRELVDFMENNVFELISMRKLDPLPFNILFNPHTSKFGFEVVDREIIKSIFINENTDPMFGFTPGSHLPYDEKEHVYWGQNMAVFKGVPFVYICLDQLTDSPYLGFMTPHPTKTPQNVLARIQINADILHYVYSTANSTDFYRSIEPLRPLILDHLTFSFLDPEGNLVDFQGVDHSLILRITSSLL
jgi:hypothetical protein